MAGENKTASSTFGIQALHEKLEFLRKSSRRASPAPPEPETPCEAPDNFALASPFHTPSVVEQTPTKPMRPPSRGGPELRPDDSVSMVAGLLSKQGGTNTDGGASPAASKRSVNLPATRQGTVIDGGGSPAASRRSLNPPARQSPAPTLLSYLREAKLNSQDNTALSAGPTFDMNPSAPPTAAGYMPDPNLPDTRSQHRGWLENEAREAEQAAEDAKLQQCSDVAYLAEALTRLQLAEEQMRTLQAQLISERVYRTHAEQRAGEREERMQDLKLEYREAVRALRRSRSQGERVEADKAAYQRTYEVAKNQLWKYHEELQVRDARASGREEGRAQAFEETERFWERWGPTGMAGLQPEFTGPSVAQEFQQRVQQDGQFAYPQEKLSQMQEQTIYAQHVPPQATFNPEHYAPPPPQLPQQGAGQYHPVPQYEGRYTEEYAARAPSHMPSEHRARAASPYGPQILAPQPQMRADAAGSYLAHVERNADLRSMAAESNMQHRPPSAVQDWAWNKPLPDPTGSHVGSTVPPPQSQSRGAPSVPGHAYKPSNADSIGSLQPAHVPHAHPHSLSGSYDGRYPVFVPSRPATTVRSSGHYAVDPATLPLPPSGDPSVVSQAYTSRSLRPPGMRSTEVDALSRIVEEEDVASPRPASRARSSAPPRSHVSHTTTVQYNTALGLEGMSGRRSVGSVAPSIIVQPPVRRAEPLASRSPQSSRSKTAEVSRVHTPNVSVSVAMSQAPSPGPPPYLPAAASVAHSRPPLTMPGPAPPLWSSDVAYAAGIPLPQSRAPSAMASRSPSRHTNRMTNGSEFSAAQPRSILQTSTPPGRGASPAVAGSRSPYLQRPGSGASAASRQTFVAARNVPLPASRPHSRVSYQRMEHAEI